MMTLRGIHLNPWSLFDELTDLDRRLDDAFRVSGLASRAQYPRVNVYENESGLVLEAELPGVDPAKVEITADGDELILKGTRRVDGEELAFERRFTLPFATESDGVVANYKLGVLSIALPKSKHAAKRSIAIQAA